MLVASICIEKQLTDSHAGLNLIVSVSPRTVPNMSVYWLDHHYQDQWLNIERCYLIFLHFVYIVKNGNWFLVFVPCYICHS